MGYNARLDMSLGKRKPGKKKQTLKSRRKESEGTEKKAGKGKYAGDKSMKENKPKTKKAKQAKVKKVMEEYKDKKLRSGSKKGPKVTNRKKALAIALSEAGITKKKGKK